MSAVAPTEDLDAVSLPFDTRRPLVHIGHGIGEKMREFANTDVTSCSVAANSVGVTVDTMGAATAIATTTTATVATVATAAAAAAAAAATAVQRRQFQCRCLKVPRHAAQLGVGVGAGDLEEPLDGEGG